MLDSLDAPPFFIAQGRAAEHRTKKVGKIGDKKTTVQRMIEKVPSDSEYPKVNIFPVIMGIDRQTALDVEAEIQRHTSIYILYSHP
jgi:hypothetical protein